MSWLSKSIDFINTYSLLVVFGVTINFAFIHLIFADCEVAPLPFWMFWIVASTTWCVYTVDHVLDGLKLKREAVSLRHRKHYVWRKVLLVLVGVIFVLNLWVGIAFFDHSLWLFGLIVSFFVLLHLVMNMIVKDAKWIGVFKESAVAVVVTLTMASTVFFQNTLSLSNDIVLIIGYYLCLNLANLLLFSWFDHEVDMEQQFSSISLLLGQDRTLFWVRMLFVGQIGFMLGLMWQLPFYQCIPLLLMTSLLFVVAQFRPYFQKNERYRFYGDFIYLLPLLAFLF